ncbi:MAG: hypothetical protein JXA33_09315, partial [Anaerolineae bacterium]|nr:hypothetical protein [Anaerolineae bacterium]
VGLPHPANAKRVRANPAIRQGDFLVSIVTTSFFRVWADMGEGMTLLRLTGEVYFILECVASGS